MKKGIFHIHSNYSYDGISSLNYIIKSAKKNELNFIILTDHHSIEGSLKLSELVFNKNLQIEVPISAEYKTSHGDIIAMFIMEDIQEMDWPLFQVRVKEQNGIMILPHPYDNHKNVDEIAQLVDVIEVFNGRSSIKNNIKSYLLAKKFNKPMIWASDSHIPSSLGNVIIGFNSEFSLRDALLNNHINPLYIKNSSSTDLFISQLKKTIVEKNIKLFLVLIIVHVYKNFKRLFSNN